MQLSINFEAAREAGKQASERCTDKAQRADPEFSEKACTAILAHLQAVGHAPGETLTNIAIAKGARPHDSRAFGAIFASLSRRGLIRTVGYCMREKGHGTAGGRVWAICK